jgi:transglutaminase-like putative cysteine protease
MNLCLFRQHTLAALIATGLAASYAPLVSATCLISTADPQLCETREIRFNGTAAAALSAKAAELGTAAAIYAYLRNNAGYTPYFGAHSDSINSFGGMSGNDVDLASTLIAMLRSQGIKARYVDGQAEVANPELANWLRVDANNSAQLPFSLLGINYSNSVLISGSGFSYATNFSHVWVEALVPYRAYRGAVAAPCTQENADCRWVALDPSFKQKKYSHPEYRLLLRNQTFDYTGYFNAENSNYPFYATNNYQNKNPELIFEEAALNYLWQNYPGLTLDDVADPGDILPDLSGLLPASLPYNAAINARYNSVDDFDAAATATAATTWSTYLKVNLQVSSCGDATQALPALTMPMAAFTSSRLSFGLVNPSGTGTRQLGFRLNGALQGNAVPLGTTVTCASGGSQTLSDTTLLDATLATSVRTAIYPGLIIDGYYVVANGVDVANQSQVQIAYAQLEAANVLYPLLTNATDVYVDANGNGVIDPGELPLMDHPQARDALTGGLLDVASRLYLASMREGNERYQLLRYIVNYPLASFGLVSTAQAVQYLNSTSFGVTPKGLLIDLRGFYYTSGYQPDTAAVDNEAFKFEGHFASSLEHEVWQKVTGLDAISTMRGFQTALNESQTLLDVKNSAPPDPIPGMLNTLGFLTSPPAAFSPVTYPIYSRSMYTWVYTGSNQANAQFNLIRGNASGVASSVLNAEPAVFSQASNTQGYLAAYYNDQNNLLNLQAGETNLKTATYTWQNTAFPTMYIVKTEISSSSPAGSFTDSVTPQSGSTNTYNLTVSETVHNTPAVYSVSTNNYLATPGKSSYSYTTPSLAGYSTLPAIPVTLSTNNTAFTVTSGGSSSVTSLPNPFPFTINKVGYLTDADMVVQVNISGYLLNNGQLYSFNNTPFASVSFQIRNNRVIEADVALTIPGFNTTNLIPYTCVNGTVMTGTATPDNILPYAQQCFEADVAKYGFAFYDQNAGFKPGNYLYRDASASTANTQLPVSFLKSVQTDMYNSSTAGLVEYWLPTAMPYGTNYLFNVYLRNLYYSNGNFNTSTYAIQNQQ